MLINLLYNIALVTLKSIRAITVQISHAWLFIITLTNLKIEKELRYNNIVKDIYIYFQEQVLIDAATI